MSLLEWLGESHNPGPVGGVDVGGRRRAPASRPGVLCRVAIAVALLALLLHLAVGVWNAGVLPVILGIAVYLVLGYFVHPRADLSNVGWLGGVIDHPFRYSDDINRFLLFLGIILWPGRFVTEALVDAVRLLARAKGSGA